jgi:hypothetical protein
MSILVIKRVPSLTQERYEDVVRRLTNGKSRFESPDDVPFDGLLVHAAAESDDGFLIVDIFESQEALDRFSETITPITRAAGIEQGAEHYPTHTFVMSQPSHATSAQR